MLELKKKKPIPQPAYKILNESFQSVKHLGLNRDWNLKKWDITNTHQLRLVCNEAEL